MFYATVAALARTRLGTLEHQSFNGLVEVTKRNIKALMKLVKALRLTTDAIYLIIYLCQDAMGLRWPVMMARYCKKCLLQFAYIFLIIYSYV